LADVLTKVQPTPKCQELIRQILWWHWFIEGFADFPVLDRHSGWDKLHCICYIACSVVCVCLYFSRCGFEGTHSPMCVIVPMWGD
jgi:hypothetical protein